MPADARFCLAVQERPVLFLRAGGFFSLSIFGGSPAMWVTPTFLCPSLLPPSFIPAPACLSWLLYPHHALCVDHHPPGHQPGTGTHSKVKPHLCFVNGKLVSLKPLCRSGCVIASSTKTRNSLCASFARPSEPRMLFRTLTCAPKTQ